MERLQSTGIIASIDLSSGIDVVDQIVDQIRGVQADISQVVVEWNATAYPIFSSLPQGVSETRWDLDDTINPWKNGLDGANVFIENDATATLAGGRYWNATESRPKTIKEVVADLWSAYNDIDIVASTASGISAEAMAAIGIRIFDSSQTSAVGSLDELSARNRLDILQVARDLYDDDYDNLTGTGNPSYTNYSVRDHLAALLIAHGAALDTTNTVTHSYASGSGSSYGTFAGATDAETSLSSEVVVGGFTFDPAQYGAGISDLTVSFEGLLLYEAAAAAGAGKALLYDMGAPGSLGAGTLRSTLTTGTTRNQLTKQSNTLTVKATPSLANDIYNVERVYELRLQTDGSGDVADIAYLSWGGIRVEPT
jgi:hypothetical protein